MSTDLDLMIEKLKKLELKSRNIDELYELRKFSEGDELRIAGLNYNPGSTPSSNPEMKDKLRDYLKSSIMYQKQEIMTLTQNTMIALKNPMEADSLIEKFGGATTIREIYSEGVFEIKSLIKEYKMMLKEIKKL